MKISEQVAIIFQLDYEVVRCLVGTYVQLVTMIYWCCTLSI
jgi:hypothetical protein